MFTRATLLLLPFIVVHNHYHIEAAVVSCQVSATRLRTCQPPFDESCVAYYDVDDTHAWFARGACSSRYSTAEVKCDAETNLNTVECYCNFTQCNAPEMYEYSNQAKRAFLEKNPLPTTTTPYEASSTQEILVVLMCVGVAVVVIIVLLAISIMNSQSEDEKPEQEKERRLAYVADYTSESSKYPETTAVAGL